MRSIAAVCSLVLIGSCNSNSTSEGSSKLPGKPGSIQAVEASLKGKNFKTVDVGTVSPFQMDKDNPYEWQDNMKDSSAKPYLTERMSFSLHFLNDTGVTIFDDGQEKLGTYKVDTITNGDEPPGIKLRIAHTEYGFGNDLVTVTYTYPVNGINDKQLFLLTPRDFNRRKIVVLMEAK